MIVTSEKNFTNPKLNEITIITKNHRMQSL